MKHNAVRLISVGFVFAAAASAARANDFMFSEAAMIVVFPAFWLWFFAGLIIWRVKKKEFFFLGFGGLAAVLFSFFGLAGHLEMAFAIWMFYLGFLTVYYFFNRGMEPRTRKLNLYFHGAFLAIVMAGGIAAKISIWSRHGFSAWAGRMREIGPFFLIAYGIIATAVGMWFYSRMEKKARIHKNKQSL